MSGCTFFPVLMTVVSLHCVKSPEIPSDVAPAAVARARIAAGGS